MFTPQLADRRLHFGWGLMGARRRPVRSGGEGWETSLLVARDPRLDALPRDAEALAHRRDHPAIRHDGQDHLPPAVQHAEFNLHGTPTDRDALCQPAAGVTHN